MINRNGVGALLLFGSAAAMALFFTSTDLAAYVSGIDDPFNLNNEYRTDDAQYLYSVGVLSMLSAWAIMPRNSPPSGFERLVAAIAASLVIVSLLHGVYYPDLVAPGLADSSSAALVSCALVPTFVCLGTQAAVRAFGPQPS